MAIGPGAQKTVATDRKSMLDGTNEFEFITLLNPFTEDFVVRVGQDIAVNAPFPIGRDESGQTSQITNTERDAAQVYGLNLRNKDYIGKKHIAIDTVIPAGKTRRFKGNEAKVALTQLVNELMQHEGNTRLLSDPELRAEAEARIIKGRGSIQDLMDSQLQTPRLQMDEALRKANESDNEGNGQSAGTEIGATGQTSGTTSANSGEQTSNPERRGPGRPKRT